MPDSHDPQRYTRNRSFGPYENLFIAVVKLSIKQKDTKFICEGEGLYRLAEVCGVSGNVVEEIRANYYK
jgi:hypothetical protein